MLVPALRFSGRSSNRHDGRILLMCCPGLRGRSRLAVAAHDRAGTCPSQPGSHRAFDRCRLGPSRTPAARAAGGQGMLLDACEGCIGWGTRDLARLVLRVPMPPSGALRGDASWDSDVMLIERPAICAERRAWIASIDRLPPAAIGPRRGGGRDTVHIAEPQFCCLYTAEVRYLAVLAPGARPPGEVKKCSQDQRSTPCPS